MQKVERLNSGWSINKQKQYQLKACSSKIYGFLSKNRVSILQFFASKFSFSNFQPKKSKSVNCSSVLSSDEDLTFSVIPFDVSYVYVQSMIWLWFLSIVVSRCSIFQIIWKKKSILWAARTQTKKSMELNRKSVQIRMSISLSLANVQIRFTISIVFVMLLFSLLLENCMFRFVTNGQLTMCHVVISVQHYSFMRFEVAIRSIENIIQPHRINSWMYTHTHM